MLIGNLGRDAETKFTPSGQARTTFSIATTRQWKDRQTGENKVQTDWHNIVAWGKERVADYLKKGKQIYVEGRIETRSWDDKDGQKKYMTEIIAETVQLLGGAGGGGGRSGGGRAGGDDYDYGGGAGAGGGDFSQAPPDDDVPF